MPKFRPWSAGGSKYKIEPFVFENKRELHRMQPTFRTLCKVPRPITPVVITPGPIAEHWEHFSYLAGWRVLYKQRDHRRKLLITYMQNRHNGEILPFYNGKQTSATAAAAAKYAAQEAGWAYFAAQMETLQGVARKAVFSAAIKLLLRLSRVRKRLQEERLRQIQIRVEELIGSKAPSITVNLVDREIRLDEQIEFEGGKAVIKAESAGLMKQIQVAASSIVTTCDEFQVPQIHLRIEGHTSFSKKSKDGGAQTSNDRARAVVADLVRHGVPAATLHASGFGCNRPLVKPPKNPLNRRVEIHVMNDLEVRVHRMQVEESARRASYVV